MSQKRRVLIVEDSPAMRQLLSLAIQRLPGVQIDEAGDGVAALKALKTATTNPYDLVFLDLNMPVMDGMKLLGKLREDPSSSNTTVAVVTTTENSETEKQARTLGAKYFVRKPVNRRAVEKILTEVFGVAL
jgi:two-component system chemotaxis response regulator CheY